MNQLIDVCRIFLGLVFLCSVVGKLRSAAAFGAFRATVVRLAPALRGWSRAVAVLVVGAEAAVVGALAVPTTTVAGFALAAVLLAVFTGALTGALRGSAPVECHCFGGGAPIARRHVVRNAGLLGAALTGLVVELTQLTASDPVRPVADTAGGPAAMLLPVGAALLLTVVTVTLDDLAHLFGRGDAHGAAGAGAGRTGG
ncbi:MauE/DoxX family redox-associated membrane protein [Streptomyces sp. NPDC058657]|uniref:MauE/DoxX family redox-associated membrane protein n=1 Tax=unclassified Streptomyces TaxID=2593676 RepID=UPI00365DE044